MPRPDNAIFTLSRALARLSAYEMPIALTPATRRFLETLARTSPQPLAGHYQTLLSSTDPAAVARADREISRDPLDIVSHAIGAHHDYPDGLVLFLGTMFAPTQDRHGPGQGFTHEVGDEVVIFAPELGALVNRVLHSDQAARWNFGIGALMRSLARRGLLAS